MLTNILSWDTVGGVTDAACQSASELTIEVNMPSLGNLSWARCQKQQGVVSFHSSARARAPGSTGKDQSEGGMNGWTTQKREEALRYTLEGR